MQTVAKHLCYIPLLCLCEKLNYVSNYWASNSKVNCQIESKIKLIKGLMVVLVICKNEEDYIKHEDTRAFTAILLLYVKGSHRLPWKPEFLSNPENMFSFSSTVPHGGQDQICRNLPAIHRDSEVQNANGYHGRTDDESSLHYYNAHRISLRVG